MSAMDNDPNAAHRRAWDLIPWVVNGSASDDERRLVEHHADVCADCREEYDFQCRLRDGMAPPTTSTALDTAQALGRFWGRIDAEQAVRLWDKQPEEPPRSHETVRRWSGRRWQSALIAAVVVQALALATLLGMLWERPHSAEYRVLTEPQAVAADIRLVPAPGLALSELRALLERHGLQVLQANSDASHFAVGLRPGAGLSVAETVKRLRAEPAVLLAEPMGPPR